MRERDTAVRRITLECARRTCGGQARAARAIVHRMSRYAASVCLASLAACHAGAELDVSGVPDAAIRDAPPGDAPSAAPGDAPFATPTLVQEATAGASSGSPLTVTLVNRPAAGDVLIVLAGAGQAPLSGVSGGGVATWTPAARSPVNCNEEIWYGTSDGTSAVVSILLTGNKDVIFGHVGQWHGLATAPLDVAVAGSAAAGPAAPGTLVTRQAHDLLVLAASEPLPVTWGEPAPGSWTALKMVTAAPCEQAAWYRLVTETGSYAPTVTESGTAKWDAATAAFTVAP